MYQIIIRGGGWKGLSPKILKISQILFPFEFQKMRNNLNEFLKKDWKQRAMKSKKLSLKVLIRLSKWTRFAYAENWLITFAATALSENMKAALIRRTRFWARILVSRCWITGSTIWWMSAKTKSENSYVQKWMKDKNVNLMGPKNPSSECDLIDQKEPKKGQIYFWARKCQNVIFDDLKKAIGMLPLEFQCMSPKNWISGTFLFKSQLV